MLHRFKTHYPRQFCAARQQRSGRKENPELGRPMTVPFASHQAPGVQMRSLRCTRLLLSTLATRDVAIPGCPLTLLGDDDDDEARVSGRPNLDQMKVEESVSFILFGRWAEAKGGTAWYGGVSYQNKIGRKATGPLTYFPTISYYVRSSKEGKEGRMRMLDTGRRARCEPDLETEA